MTVDAWLHGDVIALSGWVAPKAVLLNLVAHMIMLHVPRFAGAYQHLCDAFAMLEGRTIDDGRIGVAGRRA